MKIRLVLILSIILSVLYSQETVELSNSERVYEEFKDSLNNVYTDLIIFLEDMEQISRNTTDIESSKLLTSQVVNRVNGDIQNISSIMTAFKEAFRTELSVEKQIIIDQKEEQIDELTIAIDECNNSNITALANLLAAKIKEYIDVSTQYQAEINKNTKLKDQKEKLDAKVINKDKTIKFLKGKIKALEEVLDDSSNFSFGVALGYNYESVGEYYYAIEDSSFVEKQKSPHTGVISAVITYRLDKICDDLRFVLHIPITDNPIFDNNKNINGFFLKKVPIGFGLSYHIARKVSIGLIWTLNERKKIDLQTLRANDFKVVQSPYEAVDINNYKTEPETYYNITIGCILHF